MSFSFIVVAGQRVQTIFGEGVIASFIDAGGISTSPKYRVKLPFGLGHLSPSAILYAIPTKDALYVRRDGIMVRDETSDYGYLDDSPRLDPKYQLLFGTEITYQFFRLYLLLCALLANIHQHVQKFPPLTNPSDLWVHVNDNGTSRKKKSPKLNYTSMYVALRKVIQNEMSSRDFETLARNISRDIVHQMAVLPILMDRCVERLVKLAEEDTLLQLYDYCHGTTKIDPVTVKSQCLAIAPDAYYRIQMDTGAGNVRFCCLENDPLLVYPTTTMDDVEKENTVGGSQRTMAHGSSTGSLGGGDDDDIMDTTGEVEDRATTPMMAAAGRMDTTTDDGERMEEEEDPEEESDRIPLPPPHHHHNPHANKRTRFM